MRLYYKGKFDLNPDSLPHGAHMPNAVPFKEAKDSKTLAVIAGIGGAVLLAVLLFFAIFRLASYHGEFRLSPRLLLAPILSMLLLLPHEILHAVCFREDVYLYTNFRQGLLFVVGPETMSRGRFVFMSLLPNLVLGALPYAVGLLVPQLEILLFLGAIMLASGFGDFYNVFNALTQMPRGARTYLYQFNSFWYLPGQA